MDQPVATMTTALLGVTTDLAGPAPLIAALRRAFAELLAGDGVPASVRSHVDLTGEDLNAALAQITEAVVTRSPLLCVHAGVVRGPAGVLAVPGFSGLGKSTLTASLVRHGFEYVSDEALALDRRTLRVARFPRPISVAPDVWSRLGLEDVAVTGELERQFTPGRFGRTMPAPPAHTGGWPDGAPPVTDIVLAERLPGAAAELRPAGRGAAVEALLRRSFNHFMDPADSFRTAVHVVRGARVWRASYAEAAELAEMLATELGAGDQPAATRAR